MNGDHTPPSSALVLRNGVRNYKSLCLVKDGGMIEPITHALPLISASYYVYIPPDILIQLMAGMSIMNRAFITHKRTKLKVKFFCCCINFIQQQHSKEVVVVLIS